MTKSAQAENLFSIDDWTIPSGLQISKGKVVANTGDSDKFYYLFQNLKNINDDSMYYLAFEAGTTLEEAPDSVAKVSCSSGAYLSGKELKKVSCSFLIGAISYITNITINNVECTGTYEYNSITDPLRKLDTTSTSPYFIISYAQESFGLNIVINGQSSDNDSLIFNIGSLGREFYDTTFDLPIFADFYTKKHSAITEFEIDAENFADNYYVEAKTTFKRQYDGKELDAMITFPNVKVQSNFTFNMAATGDPSTFTFTMDAMPGRILTSSNGKKVLCAMQIVDDEAINANTEASIDDNDSVLKVYEEKARVYLDESGTTTYFPEKPRSTLWYESERKLYNSQYVDTIINTFEGNTDRAYYVGEYLYGEGVDAKVYDRWHVDSGDNGSFEDTEDRQKGGYIYVLTEKNKYK
jgi:hypothetical protein